MADAFQMSFSDPESSDEDANCIPSGQGSPPGGFVASSVRESDVFDWEAFCPDEPEPAFDVLSDEYVVPNSGMF